MSPAGLHTTGPAAKELSKLKKAGNGPPLRFHGCSMLQRTKKAEIRKDMPVVKNATTEVAGCRVADVGPMRTALSPSAPEDSFGCLIHPNVLGSSGTICL